MLEPPPDGRRSLFKDSRELLMAESHEGLIFGETV